MADNATPNLPSRDFSATVDFYARLGFVEEYRDEGWLILTRGTLKVEFFPFPQLNPRESSFGCCLRLDDVDAFVRECLGAGIPQTSHGFPRVHAPQPVAAGLRIGALLDPDGTLLRLVENRSP